MLSKNIKVNLKKGVLSLDLNVKTNRDNTRTCIEQTNLKNSNVCMLWIAWNHLICPVLYIACLYALIGLCI